MSTPVAYAEQLTRDAKALYTAVVATASHDTTMCVALEDDARIQVYDAVLPDPFAYRRRALAVEAQTYFVGEVAWHGLSECKDPEFLEWLASIRPDLTPSLSLIRRSPLGQVEPHFIHTDRDMGDWTAILYLTETPDSADGTDFWRHRWSGATESCASSPTDRVTEGLAWRDLSQWGCRLHVPAAFNRAILFPASCFHSRAIYDNYGTGDESRLTQIVFCKAEA